MPHIFGPTLIMPGQSFRLPFAQASTYSFQCTAHANGQLSVIVDPAPSLGVGKAELALAQADRRSVTLNSRGKQ